MAHEPVDGPLGLEGRHQFKSGDQFPPGTEAEVLLYGKHQREEDAWLKIDRIIGLHGLGDADDNRDPAEGRSEEIPYPSAQRGRSVVYEGRVCAYTLPDMRRAANEFRSVAAESRERRTGSMTIVDPADTGQGFATGMRCIALDIDDLQAFGPNHQPSPYVRNFTLGLRAHSPRWIWYPIESGLAKAESAIFTVENEGLAPADLKFDVFSDGSPMDVTLQNNTTGKFLSFVGMPIPAGDLLHIDWTQRAAVWVEAANYPAYTPNEDMMPYFDSENSDWWDAMEWGLGHGDNAIQVIGTNVDHWDVYWQHTSY